MLPFILYVYCIFQQLNEDALVEELTDHEEEEEEEEDEDDTYPDGTIKIVTLDKQTNTDNGAKRGAKSATTSVSNTNDANRNNIRRSQTFSPAGRHDNDYICKVRLKKKQDKLSYDCRMLNLKLYNFINA